MKNIMNIRFVINYKTKKTINKKKKIRKKKFKGLKDNSNSPKFRNEQLEIVINIPSHIEILICDKCSYYFCLDCKFKRFVRKLIRRIF